MCGQGREIPGAPGHSRRFESAWIAAKRRNFSAAAGLTSSQTSDSPRGSGQPISGPFAAAAGSSAQSQPPHHHASE